MGNNIGATRIRSRKRFILRRDGWFLSKLQGCFFCCIRLGKGGSSKYSEITYTRLGTGSTGKRRWRPGGDGEHLRLAVPEGDQYGSYGSMTDGSYGAERRGQDSSGHGQTHEGNLPGDASVSMSAPSRVKARLRNRGKNKKNVTLNRKHLTAVSGHGNIHPLLPKEKVFHELARTGNLPELEKMIKERINVNCMDEKDRSALHLASGQGHIEVVKTLLDSDANVDAPDKFGMNALLWATWFGQLAAVEAISNGGALVKCENKQGLTIVHCAASRGHVAILRYIVDNLLEEDSMDSDDELGPLQTLGAMQGKVTGLFGAAASYVGLKEKKEEESQRQMYRSESSFLEQRCTSQGSKTPLHLAAENGHIEAMKYLISARCNKLSRTSDGCSALHLAAKRGHVEMVSLLLENDLEIDIRNQEGMTPVLFAADEGHANVVELLLSRKASCNVKANEKRKEMAAVHFAAEKNHSTVISILHSFGANLDVQCQGGNTAVHLASIAGHIEVLQTLIVKGANANIPNDKKRFALHEATENNLTDVVEQLLIAGAWVSQVDKNGKTALMMAARAENVTITDMIIKASRYFTKRKNENRPYKIGKEHIQFRKEATEEQRQMKPVLWKLAMKQLAQKDATRLIFYWGFSVEQVQAVQTQFTGPKSWKEHTYRMLLIWLHGVEEHPMKGLYEGLVAIEKKKLAEIIRNKANQKLEGKDGCTIS